MDAGMGLAVRAVSQRKVAAAPPELRGAEQWARPLSRVHALFSQAFRATVARRGADGQAGMVVQGEQSTISLWVTR